MTARDAWEAEARNSAACARTPGHDSYWRLHRDRFLELLPPPPARILDVGCCEGRLPRDLKAVGHEVVAVDGSETLIEHARQVAGLLIERLVDVPDSDRPGDRWRRIPLFLRLRAVKW